MPTYQLKVTKIETYEASVQAENRDDAESMAAEGSGKGNSTFETEFSDVKVVVPGAEKALEAYREAAGPWDDIETAIQDLITDLLHLVCQQGEGTLTPQRIMGRALDNFIQEI